MKTKILCSLLAALFTLAIVLTGCDKAPETTSDHKTTAATTALTTTATIAKPTATEKTTTAAPTTTLVITSGSDVMVVYPPVVEGGGEPEEPIVQTVADKDPVSVLSSFFELSLPQNLSVSQYKHTIESIPENKAPARHTYIAKADLSKEQLQNIQTHLEKKYMSVPQEGIPSCLEIFRVKTQGQWNIQKNDVLKVFQSIRTTYWEEKDGTVQTDETLYGMLTKENDSYFLYLYGTGRE